MISDPLKFQVGKMSVDVNWSEKVKPCKKIRFKFDGKTEIIDRDELYSLLMLFGNDEQQEKLIPVKSTKMVLIERMLHIIAKKDIKEGDLITVPYKYSMTEEAYDEAVKENPRSFRKVEEKVSTESA